MQMVVRTVADARAAIGQGMMSGAHSTHILSVLEPRAVPSLETQFTDHCETPPDVSAG
jgi:hypothetical protein